MPYRIGEGTSERTGGYTDAEKASYIQAARARGVSQGKIDAFLAENPDDYPRLSVIEPDETPGGAAAAGAGSALPSMQGLSKIVAPGGAGGTDTPALPPSIAALGSAESGGVNIAQSTLGLLRSLGRRMPPMESSALAGLRRRIY